MYMNIKFNFFSFMIILCMLNGCLTLATWVPFCNLNVFILQMISLLPGKILKLLEFVGFSGNKVKMFSYDLEKSIDK